MLKVEATGKKVRLHKPITLVGRAPECSLLVRASDVSKNHCQIALDTDKVIVEDLGSANGTFVNAKRTSSPLPAQDGDVLTLGHCAFRVLIPGDTNDVPGLGQGLAATESAGSTSVARRR